MLVTLPELFYRLRIKPGCGVYLLHRNTHRLQFSHVEDTDLATDEFRGQSFVLDDFHGGEPIVAGSPQHRVEEAQKLDFVAFFPHEPRKR